MEKGFKPGHRKDSEGAKECQTEEKAQEEHNFCLQVSSPEPRLILGAKGCIIRVSEGRAGPAAGAVTEEHGMGNLLWQGYELVRGSGTLSLVGWV